MALSYLPIDERRDEPPRHRADAATNRNAIAQTQLRKHVASMAWARAPRGVTPNPKFAVSL
jgi:hypothetical protein